MTDDSGLTRKDMLIKKAIRDYAAEYGVGINNYGSITNFDLLHFMKEKKMGVRWISKNCIRVIRATLTDNYRSDSEK